MTMVLPSDLTTVPVRRSPFLSVTWSANDTDESPKSAVNSNTSRLRSTAYPPNCRVVCSYLGSQSCFVPRNRDEKAEQSRLIRSQARGRLALGFGILLVGRSLRRGMIFHAIFQSTNPLAQTLAELR